MNKELAAYMRTSCTSRMDPPREGMKGGGNAEVKGERGHLESGGEGHKGLAAASSVSHVGLVVMIKYGLRLASQETKHR